MANAVWLALLPAIAVFILALVVNVRIPIRALARSKALLSVLADVCVNAVTSSAAVVTTLLGVAPDSGIRDWSATTWSLIVALGILLIAIATGLRAFIARLP